MFLESGAHLSLDKQQTSYAIPLFWFFGLVDSCITTMPAERERTVFEFQNS